MPDLLTKRVNPIGDPATEVQPVLLSVNPKPYSTTYIWDPRVPTQKEDLPDRAGKVTLFYQLIAQSNPSEH